MLNKIRSLQDNKDFMRYFKNTSWLFAEKVLRIFVGLLIGIWVARYLGPEQFGIFSYAQSFVALFSAIATLGLDSIVVRELISNEKERKKIIGTAFWLKVLSSIVVIIILFVTINITSDNSYNNLIVIIIASAIIFQSFNVIDFYFQSKVLSKYVVYANTISLLISSLIKIVLIFTEAPLIAFAWVVLFDSIVLSLGLIYFYNKNKLNFNIKDLPFDKSFAVGLLKDSWPLALSLLAIMAYKKIDQIMLQNILESSIEVGYYAAAAHITIGLSFIPVVIAQSIFPEFIRRYNNNIDIKEYFLIINSSLLYFSLILYFIVLFFSNNIIDFLYGEEYQKTGIILSLHFMINIFIFIGVIVDKLILLDNNQKNITIRVILGLILNILMNFILIPISGSIGASYATIISQLFTSVLFLSFFYRTRKYFLWQFLSLTYPFYRFLILRK